MAGLLALDHIRGADAVALRLGETDDDKTRNSQRLIAVQDVTAITAAVEAPCEWAADFRATFVNAAEMSWSVELRHLFTDPYLSLDADQDR